MIGFRRPTALRVERGLLDKIVAHLRAELPREGVGLLATVADGDAARARSYYPGTNVDASTTRYTMDPEEVLAAFADMEANRWDFGAIVHSHPLSPPVPSTTDLREAFYPDQLLLIVGMATDPPAAQGWSVRAADERAGAAVSEVPVVVEEKGEGVPPLAAMWNWTASARNVPDAGSRSRGSKPPEVSEGE